MQWKENYRELWENIKGGPCKSKTWFSRKWYLCVDSKREAILEWHERMAFEGRPHSRLVMSSMAGDLAVSLAHSCPRGNTFKSTKKYLLHSHAK